MRIGDLVTMKIDVPLSKTQLSERVKGRLGIIIKIEWSLQCAPLFTVKMIGGHEPIIRGLASSLLRPATGSHHSDLITDNYFLES